MFEKVNPSHPDKVADRIAGALVDYAYTQASKPKVAIEVLIGHGECHIIAETSVHIPTDFVEKTVKRVSQLDDIRTDYKEYPQDEHLAENQSLEIRCGDNGIFKGVPTNGQEKKLSMMVRELYKDYPTDGKYIARFNVENNSDEIIACQSCADSKLKDRIADLKAPDDTIYAINPLGEWTGGVNVDSGATNRKLGSDMGRAATGGGLHGKDLTKADVSLNIYAFLKAQELGYPVQFSCAIGDTEINGVPYLDIVNEAYRFIKAIGGFEKFAEWGLV